LGRRNGDSKLLLGLVMGWLAVLFFGEKNRMLMNGMNQQLVNVCCLHYDHEG
jgi:hypothetical protein